MSISKSAQISKSQVVDAVTKLSAQSVPVTARSVREFLGRGSYSTITKLLREVRAYEAENETAEEKFAAFPDKIRSILSSILLELRRTVKEEADAERREIDSLKRNLRHRWAGLVRDKFEAIRALDTERKFRIALQEDNHIKAQLLDQIAAMQRQNLYLEKCLEEFTNEHLMKIAKLEQDLSSSQARVFQLSMKLAGIQPTEPEA